jgi:hypothetical protein
MIESPLCPSCALRKQQEDRERDEAKREDTELQFQRLDAWKSAANLLESDDRGWNDDGRPLPTDYLNLAAFLSGMTGDDN